MIIYNGNSDYEPSAPPEWNQELFDLDTLIMKYQGAEDKLNIFLDSLVRFQPASIDPYMFLTNWRVSGGTKAFPEVELNFSGKKGGVLPFGRSTTTTQTQTAQATTPYGPISITYRARTPVYQWVSRLEGEGGTIPQNVTVSAATTMFLIPGFASVAAGSNVLNISPANTNIRVGDRISVAVHDPSIPIVVTGEGVVISFLCAVTEIISSAQFRIAQVPPIAIHNYAESTTARPTILGIHTAGLPLTVVNIRMGCGITPISGAQLDLIGPILVSNYFLALVTPDLSSEEVVPDRYWRNRQSMVTSLTPLPCS
jgi:hypothetical protein